MRERRWLAYFLSYPLESGIERQSRWREVNWRAEKHSSSRGHAVERHTSEHEWIKTGDYDR